MFQIQNIQSHFRISLLLIFTFLLVAGCKKQPSKPVVVTPDERPVEVFTPVVVQKTVQKKIYVHLMPWFETKETNSPIGTWGQHWTMANKNPDIINAAGENEIASHYYPLTGPYASGDPDIIEYQLLLMKLSGIDGVLIDWPGTTNLYDYPLLVKNAEKLIEQTGKAGLTFGIVYEDQNINHAFDQHVIADKIAAGKNDMKYLETNYFGRKNYISFNNKPLLLVFGPQAFTTEASWTEVFSALKNKPSFFTLWYESNEAGVNVAGEYAWVYKNHLTDLNNFYQRSLNGTKIGSAYPGFDDFYKEGGWGNTLFKIASNGKTTFQTTLDLAIQSNSAFVQLVTWNDYGEGTMIEPTKQFGYDLLTSLQATLGVSYTKKELELVYKLYTLRKKYQGNQPVQVKLNEAFNAFASLKVEQVSEILNAYN